MDNAGTWIAVYVGDGMQKYHVEPDEWNEIKTAYVKWVEKKIDTVLELTAVGDRTPIVVAASKISDFTLSTPDGRKLDREYRAAMKAEEPPTIPGVDDVGG